MPLEQLTRERVVEALSLLGRKAAEANVELEMCIYGQLLPGQHGGAP
jgi:hypothetical protein